LQHEILRLKQSQYLTQNVAQLSEDLGLEDPAVFICGDFNSRWGSEVTQFMKNRKDTLPNPLPNLHSAYDYFLRHLFKTDDEKQLEKALNTYHTQFTHELKCHIDYIWFNNHNTQVMEVLELLDEEKILTSCGVSLPSKYYSSDHVALMATFKVPNIQ
jgi:mRNA deadenylase 3'-5' endonuclease subunit Ccr4